MDMKSKGRRTNLWARGYRGTCRIGLRGRGWGKVEGRKGEVEDGVSREEMHLGSWKEDSMERKSTQRKDTWKYTWKSGS